MPPNDKYRKVALSDNIKRFIWVAENATDGAEVGINLWWPDGTLVTEAEIRNAAAPDDPNGGLADTIWSLIGEIPPNIIALAALTGTGYAWRNADGTWELRRSGRAVVPFAFGDASPATLFIPAEDAMLSLLRVVIDTPFDGAGAALSIGTLADPDLYMATDENDPTQAASYEVKPDVDVSTGVAILLTIAPGAGATAGAGRILIDSTPLSES